MLPEPELSQEQLEEIRQARQAAIENLKRIDKFSLIDVPKEEIARLREAAQENIDKADKILAVYGNGK